MFKVTNNLTARLGASSNKGGTNPSSPFDYVFFLYIGNSFTSVKSSNPNSFWLAVNQLWIQVD